MSLILFLIPAVVWWGLLIDWVIRGRHLPRLVDQPASGLQNPGWPSLAVIVPARNEEKWIETAIRSLAAQDYPGLKIFVVDDRSIDQTASILARLAQDHKNIMVETVRKLPPGWLGKTHALWKGTQLAGKADWFLFTDADVIYEAHTLKRAIVYAETQSIDQLSLYPGMIVRGFWEGAFVSYFSLLSFIGYSPWRVNNPESGAYFAIGAFNLVRREAYERAGTHKRLALEVVDDARLCRLMKHSGARVKIIIGRKSIHIRWQEGVLGMMRGLTKNLFAGLNYNIANTILAIVGLIVLSFLPFVGLINLPQGSGWLCVATVAALFVLYGMSSRGTGLKWFYAVAHPLAAILMLAAMIGSALKAFSRGGIIWRGTLYPLEELKRGQ